MAKIHDSLALTDAEIDQLMSTVGRCRIATLGPGEDINLTPMTFGWAGGKAYIFARGQKVANLRSGPKATVLVDVGEAWRELKGIMMRGEAHVLEDADAEAADEHLAAAQLNLGRKHGLTAEDGKVKPYAATATDRSRRWLVFEPRHVVTWNNENLP